MRKKRVSKAVLVTGVLVLALLAHQSHAYDLAEYYPLTQGFLWQYRETEDGHQEYRTEYIEGYEEVQGVTTVKRLELDGEYECLLFDPVQGLLEYKDCEPWWGYELYDPPLNYLPAQMDVGETHSGSSTATMFDPSGQPAGTATIDYSVTLEGVESIRVSAGYFYECLRFSITDSWDSGEQGKEEGQGTSWLAKGVGLVKEEWTGRWFDPEGHLIEEWAGIDELVFYATEHGPPRLQWDFELAVFRGTLGAGFKVIPGFRNLLESATLVGPGGFSYEFDLDNDVLAWLTECSYLVMHWRDFPEIEEIPYGEYTLTLTYFDGVEEHIVQELQQVTLTPVDSSTMSYTVNGDGSIDFSWALPSLPPGQVGQYYQVRVYSADGKTRYYRSGNLRGQESLHVSPYDLRCLEKGKSYLWQVRCYDDMDPYNAVERDQSLPLFYNPEPLDGRITGYEAARYRGDLSLWFNVRPGSRDKVSQATVTGPVGSGFFYQFDLDEDWYDVSTETRINNGWAKQFPFDPSSYFGEYRFEIEFTDGHRETRTYTLGDVEVVPVDSATMMHEINKDGSMIFSWALPNGVTGQNYQVRIRSVDGTKEYHRSYSVTDGTQIYVSFYDLRALEHGRRYQWYVRAFDLNWQRMEQSGSLYFEYNPFSIECLHCGDCSLDTELTPGDALFAFQHYLGIADPPLSPCQLAEADVTVDEEITPSDALCIFQTYLGIPSCLDDRPECPWD